MSKYVIGLDYGTLSVRALLVNVESKKEEAVSVYEYPHGVMDSHLPSGKVLPANYALQHPDDYWHGLVKTIKDVVSKKHVLPEEVIGIGVDFTSSTVVVTDENGQPLCNKEAFNDEPHAYVKLWKHHGAEEEALKIDEVIKERNESWISLYGDKTSSEWMIPKIVETYNKAREVYDASSYFLEALDWITWKLTGTQVRSACGAGYKAFYRHDTGYPSKEFFKAIDPGLENLVEDKLNAPIKSIGEVAGYLTLDNASLLDLKEGTPVGVGIIDAHSSMVGTGVSKPNVMMIIMGTSSCHMMLSKKEAGIPGVCGLVKDGILPGYFGYEAGQCCVGDHFAWFVKNCVPDSYYLEAKHNNMTIYQYLDKLLENYKAGKSGLLALDWWNGVRSPLQDFNLNGLLIGMNLLTKPEEIYMALIEATAYGTRMIIESYENAGVKVDSLVLGGGIPTKNKMIVQVYADICNKEIRVSESPQASAMGAVMLGLAAADKNISGYDNIEAIVDDFGSIEDKVYLPNKDNVKVYNALYAEYKELMNYFGKGQNNVMKRLNKLRNS